MSGLTAGSSTAWIALAETVGSTAVSVALLRSAATRTGTCSRDSPRLAALPPRSRGGLSPGHPRHARGRAPGNEADQEGSSGIPPATASSLPFLSHPGPPILGILVQDLDVIPQSVSFQPADGGLQLGQGHGGPALAEDPAQGSVVG